MTCKCKSISIFVLLFQWKIHLRCQALHFTLLLSPALKSKFNSTINKWKRTTTMTSINIFSNINHQFFKDWTINKQWAEIFEIIQTHAEIALKFSKEFYGSETSGFCAHLVSFGQSVINWKRLQRNVIYRLMHKIVHPRNKILLLNWHYILFMI